MSIKCIKPKSWGLFKYNENNLTQYVSKIVQDMLFFASDIQAKKEPEVRQDIYRALEAYGAHGSRTLWVSDRIIAKADKKWMYDKEDKPGKKPLTDDERDQKGRIPKDIMAWRKFMLTKLEQPMPKSPNQKDLKSYAKKMEKYNFHREHSLVQMIKLKEEEQKARKQAQKSTIRVSSQLDKLKAFKKTEQRLKRQKIDTQRVFIALNQERQQAKKRHYISPLLNQIGKYTDQEDLINYRKTHNKIEAIRERIAINQAKLAESQRRKEKNEEAEKELKEAQKDYRKEINYRLGVKLYALKKTKRNVWGRLSRVNSGEIKLKDSKGKIKPISKTLRMRYMTWFDIVDKLEKQQRLAAIKGMSKMYYGMHKKYTGTYKKIKGVTDIGQVLSSEGNDVKPYKQGKKLTNHVIHGLKLSPKGFSFTFKSGMFNEKHFPKEGYVDPLSEQRSIQPSIIQALNKAIQNQHNPANRLHVF